MLIFKKRYSFKKRKKNDITCYMKKKASEPTTTTKCTNFKPESKSEEIISFGMNKMHNISCDCAIQFGSRIQVMSVYI